MTTESIKLVYPRIVDAVNTRYLDLLDTIYHPELINYGVDPNEPRGAYHFKQVFTGLIAACLDLRLQIDDQIAEGDKVGVRWSDIGTHTGASFWGVPGTG